MTPDAAEAMRPGIPRGPLVVSGTTHLAIVLGDTPLGELAGRTFSAAP
jgi:hypothetical protein